MQFDGLWEGPEAVELRGTWFAVTGAGVRRDAVHASTPGWHAAAGGGHHDALQRAAAQLVARPRLA